MGHIYILTDPRHPNGHPKHIRYVGITVRTIGERFVEHIRAKENTHRDNWIRQLKQADLLPECEIFETIEGATKKELGIEERYWIAQFKAWGFALTNGTSGGDGIYDMSPESKARHAANVSAAKLKRYAENPELRQAQVDRLMRWRSDEVIVEKWKSAIKDSWADDEIRKKHVLGLNQPEPLRKISEAAKRTWENQEFRDRKIAAQSGENNWKARAVVHMASGTEFKTTKFAEDWLRQNGYPKASGSAIARACKGKLDVIYGSNWKYSDQDFVPFKPKPKDGANNPAAKAVVCVETMAVFGCMLDALRWALGDKWTPQKTVGVIWRVCNKKGTAKTAHGYHWRYATEEEKLANNS